MVKNKQQPKKPEGKKKPKSKIKKMKVSFHLITLR